MITPREKRIEKLRLKPYQELSFEERLELVCERYENKQKIFYEEFVMMLFANHEVYFCYNHTEYRFDFGLPNIISLFIIEYDENYKAITKRSENYSSIIELLNSAKIDKKLIREIWDKTHFGVLPLATKK